MLNIEASRLQGQLRLLRVGLLIALGTLLAGFWLPLVTIEKFYLLENTFSIVSGVSQLWLEGRYGLFLLLGLFSIAMPLLKIGLLFRVLRMQQQPSQRTRRYLHWMHHYGKWSMLDVFVVAVLVVSVKLGALLQVQVHAGLYVFAVSVLLTMMITARVIALASKFED